MEQVFRIEIPVEAVDNTDVAALQRLETTLTKLFNTMKNSKTGIDGVFDAIETGAVDAKTAMKKVETAFDGVADGLDEAAGAAGDVSDAYDDAADDVPAPLLILRPAARINSPSAWRSRISPCGICSRKSSSLP